MTFVPAPGVYEIHQRALLWSQTIENVHYVRPTGATDPVSVAQEAHEAWKTYVLQQLTNDYELRETYVVDLTNDTAPTGTATTTPFPTGTVAEQSAPGGTCLAFSFRTNGRGRSSRGRNYISGFSEQVISGNNVNSVAQGVLLQALQDYFNTMAASALGLEHVIVSRVENSVPRITALVQPVTAITLVDGRLDSQRRRLTGRGS
jgi:hypothetical protein